MPVVNSTFVGGNPADALRNAKEMQEAQNVSSILSTMIGAAADVGGGLLKQDMAGKQQAADRAAQTAAALRERAVMGRNEQALQRLEGKQNIEQKKLEQRFALGKDLFTQVADTYVKVGPGFLSFQDGGASFEKSLRNAVKMLEGTDEDATYLYEAMRNGLMTREQTKAMSYYLKGAQKPDGPTLSKAFKSFMQNNKGGEPVAQTISTDGGQPAAIEQVVEETPAAVTIPPVTRGTSERGDEYARVATGMDPDLAANTAKVMQARAKMQELAQGLRLDSLYGAKDRKEMSWAALQNLKAEFPAQYRYLYGADKDFRYFVDQYTPFAVNNNARGTGQPQMSPQELARYEQESGDTHIPALIGVKEGVVNAKAMENGGEEIVRQLNAQNPVDAPAQRKGMSEGEMLSNPTRALHEDPRGLKAYIERLGHDMAASHMTGHKEHKSTAEAKLDLIKKTLPKKLFDHIETSFAQGTQGNVGQTVIGQTAITQGREKNPLADPVASGAINTLGSVGGGALAGNLLGPILGGAIGSLLGPAGTAAGAAIGSALATGAGAAAGGALGGALTKSDTTRGIRGLGPTVVLADGSEGTVEQTLPTSAATWSQSGENPDNRWQDLSSATGTNSEAAWEAEQQAQQDEIEYAARQAGIRAGTVFDGDPNADNDPTLGASEQLKANPLAKAADSTIPSAQKVKVDKLLADFKVPEEHVAAIDHAKGLFGRGQDKKAVAVLQKPLRSEMGAARRFANSAAVRAYNLALIDNFENIVKYSSDEQLLSFGMKDIVDARNEKSKIKIDQDRVKLGFDELAQRDRQFNAQALDREAQRKLWEAQAAALRSGIETPADKFNKTQFDAAKAIATRVDMSDFKDKATGAFDEASYVKAGDSIPGYWEASAMLLAFTYPKYDKSGKIILPTNYQKYVLEQAKTNGFLFTGWGAKPAVYGMSAPIPITGAPTTTGGTSGTGSSDFQTLQGKL